jgi:hypothetical protein
MIPTRRLGLLNAGAFSVTSILLALAMFVCAALIDFAYVRQTIAITNGLAFASANWRALSYSLGCFGWLVAVKIGVWLLPFELAGLYLGALIGVGKTGGQCHQVTDVSSVARPSQRTPRSAGSNTCRSWRQLWRGLRISAAQGAALSASEAEVAPTSCRRQEPRRSCSPRRPLRRT